MHSDVSCTVLAGRHVRTLPRGPRWSMYFWQQSEAATRCTPSPIGYCCAFKLKDICCERARGTLRCHHGGHDEVEHQIAPSQLRLLRV